MPPDILDAAPAADAALVAGVRAGDRRAIAKAITLIESPRPDHRRRADALLDALLPATGRALRIGKRRLNIKLSLSIMAVSKISCVV